MKQHFKTWVAATALSLFSVVALAQEQKPIVAKWASDKGYWVVENNVNDPLNHTIWFYNNDNMLLYKETLAGVKLNLDKRKVKMRLKKVLDATVLAWQKNKVTEENKEYVVAALR